MHDWLLENYPGISVSRRMVSNFVAYIRVRYNIPKPVKQKKGRDYMAVEDLPYGKQAQVDFGFYEMKDQNGQPVKICFMATVLSRSRYKHVFFLDRPFTTEDVIEAHEAALAYFGGIPGEFVYDQDKLMIVSEQQGDILLTEKFTAYRKARKFDIFLCRKGDPETKGKIENVVKYIKSNFLNCRTFISLPVLNAEAMTWLKRTGNGQVHGTTKRIPAEELLIEKEHLSPLGPLSLSWLEYTSYHVRKDNLITWKSNRYSVPQGTYQGVGTTVRVKQEKEHLLICNEKKEEIARHKISAAKGVTVLNTDHKRDKEENVQSLIKQVSTLFSDPQMAEQYLARIKQTKPRYIRDQLLFIRKAIAKQAPRHIDASLLFCYEHRIYSAKDFIAVLTFMCREHFVETSAPVAQEELLLKNVKLENLLATPQKSNISAYESIIHSK